MSLRYALHKLHLKHKFLGSVQHVQKITLLDHSFVPQATDKFQRLNPKQSHQSHYLQLELSELTGKKRHNFYYNICVSLIQVLPNFSKGDFTLIV